MSNLTVTRDHCRRMAKVEPDEPLWSQLADEIDAYLAGDLEDRTSAAEDAPLEFVEVKRLGDVEPTLVPVLWDCPKCRRS